MQSIPGFRRLLPLAIASVACAAAPAPALASLIVGETFETYVDGRLSTVSSSVWSSSSLTTVGSGAGLAFQGSRYAEVGSSANNQTASRTFSGISSTGVYWVQFSVQAGFTQAQLGPDNFPQVRLSDGTNNLITVLFRPDNDKIVVNYAPTAGVSATAFTTNIDYASSGWTTFTYAIDLTNKTASIYANGQAIVSSFSFTGYGDVLSTIDFRGKLPTAGTALRIDDIGFYYASPLATIPEPAGWSALAGLGALAVCATRRRHRT